MKDKFSSKKIKKDLLDLTGKKFSFKYINNTYKLIFKKIINTKKKKFIISGSQGSGKSTLLELIKKNFKNFYDIDPLCLSLDDFYLTKKQRVELSEKVHSLFVTRGVPGTHDTSKIKKIIKQFNKKDYPIRVPKFDKLIDDRMKSFNYYKSEKKMIFFEGWCCGCSPIDASYLKKNLNKIEEKDKSLKWRNYYNNKLKNEYNKIFREFDYLIYFKISDFNYVLNWKKKQQIRLKKKYSNKKNIESINLKDFILYYEKITKWMMLKTMKIKKLNVFINKNQSIIKIKNR